MTQWFYTRADQQNGPVTFEQLVELAANGGLDAVKDSVWNESMQGWTVAGNIPGLFSESSIPPIPSANSSNPYAAPSSNWGASAASDGDVLTEIEHGSEQIDAVACINRGFEITKAQFGNIFLVGFVYFVCIFGMSIVFGVLEALPSIMSSGGAEASKSMGPLGVTILVISRVVQQVFTIFLQLGLARAGLNLVSGKEVSVGLLFGQGSKLLRAIGASILFGFAVVIGFVLLIVPGVYIMLRYGQFMTAIVDRDLGIMEAFDYSSSLTTNNRLNLFVLALLSFGVGLLGMLACFVGLIFAAPVVWLAALVAYRWMQYGQRAATEQVVI
ncbi:MAG: DUF4339 domain-containing protein [Arenimonas sp.]